MSGEVSNAFVLPPALIGRADLARLAREVEALDNELESQKVRSHGAAYHMPTMSQALSDFVALNAVDLSNDQKRMELKERLLYMKDKAPIIHMTFAVTADPESLAQLVAYVRQEIHPQALLSVGLQPSLVAGVYMRTPNQVHDFSVRSLLAGKRDIIAKELESF